LYATAITRPDTSRAVNKLSEFLTNPSQLHLEAADRVLRYLHGTKSLAIQYSPNSDTFLCASDAAFADDIDRNTEGFWFKLFGGHDWKACKQKTVTASTTEAELLALSHTAKDRYLWWKDFFVDNVGLDLEDENDAPILCDNKQTVTILRRKEPIFKTQLKHVDVHNHWLRQEI
jgi:hypothetical protein